MEHSTNETSLVGSLVEGGKPFSEDWDLGRVLNILNDGSVTVAWEGSLTHTDEAIENLKTWDGVHKWAPEEEEDE